MNGKHHQLLTDHFRLLFNDQGFPEERDRTFLDTTVKGTDLALGRGVLLRLLNEEHWNNPEARKQFLEEAKWAASLQGASLPSVLFCSGESSPCFYAIENFSDEFLPGYLKKNRAPGLSTALNLTLQVSEALCEIRRRGLKLRDFSSASVGILVSQEEARCKLAHLHLAPFPQGKDSANCPEFRQNLEWIRNILVMLLDGDSEIPPELAELLDTLREPGKEKEIQTLEDVCEKIADCWKSLEVLPPDPKPAAAPTKSLDLGTVTLSDGASGHFFQALDPQKQPTVVYLFGSEDSAETIERVLRGAEKIRSHPHKNIAASVHSAREQGRTFVAFEKISGVRLVDILRKRRQLPAYEASLILEHLAAAIDHAVQHEIATLDLRLTGMRIVSPGLEPTDAWMEKPLSNWPTFTLKVASVFSQPGSRKHHEPEGDLLRHYLRGMNDAVIELLGGVVRKKVDAKKNFVPLSGLSPGGNAVVRKLATTEDEFPSATAFVSALKETVSDNDAALPSASERPYAEAPAPEQPKKKLRRGGV